jgi:hypothetical protein
MVTVKQQILYVCLCGRSGAGKDTVGKYLEQAHGFRRIAIADPMKRIAMELFDLNLDQLWGDLRDVPHERLGGTPRELYQCFGDACRRLDPDVWIRRWCVAVQEALAAGHSVVCTDLRTPEELLAARARGARVWLVRRHGAGAPGQAGEHPTERALPDLPDAAFDRCIDNDGSVAELHACVEATLGAESWA